MKKTFLFLSIVLLGVVLLAGCQKDKLETFTATIQRYNNNSGEKAYITNDGGDHYACWTNGDLVKINSTTCTASVAYRNDSSLVRIPGVPRSDAGYYAIYPAKASSGQFTNNSTITLPQEQEYRVVAAGGNHQVLDAPMAAKADQDNILKFENLCFLLKVHIGQSNNKLAAIMVEAVDNTVKLSGSGTVNFNDSGTPSLTMTSGTNSVILRMTTPVNLNVAGGTDFYIAIPALASHKELNIITKDVFGAYERVTVTAQQDIPNNIIIGVNGPDVASSTDYDFYDWIQSRSSGYIDLGDSLKPAVGARLEITFLIPNLSPAITNNLTASQFVCGSRGRTSNSENTIQWFAIGGSQGNVGSGYSATVCQKPVRFDTSNVGPRAWDKKYSILVEVKKNASNRIFGEATFSNLTDGGSWGPIAGDVSSYSSIPDDVNNIFVFGQSASQLHKGMRLYSFRYYSGTTLKHEFVPCMRRSDNTVGVYDMAGSGGFIQPTQTGSKPFTVGND